jgi:hypothetical protein
LRIWKNNRVSRKPCEQRSDLVLNGQMKVCNRVIWKTVLLENRVSGGLPVVDIRLFINRNPELKKSTNEFNLINNQILINDSVIYFHIFALIEHDFFLLQAGSIES